MKRSSLRSSRAAATTQANQEIQQIVRFEDELSFDEIIELSRSVKRAKNPDPTFHPFPKLPIEMRFEIWGKLLPDARIVQFKPHNKKRNSTLLCYSMYPELTSKFDKPSVLPYICGESRQFFLSVYPLCFSGILQNPIFFNPRTDVVLFSSERALMMFSDAVNLIPSTSARAFIAPVRKAAVRYGKSKESDDPHDSTLGLEIARDMEYRTKLRLMFERLLSLEEFIFCYPITTPRLATTSEKPMNDFVKQMQKQIEKRKEFAKKEGNKAFAEEASHSPNIKLLQCPSEKRMLERPELTRALDRGETGTLTWDAVTIDDMDLL
jgi:2EXR family